MEGRLRRSPKIFATCTTQVISCSKTNLGHLEGGAGMSAFCKLLGFTRCRIPMSHARHARRLKSKSFSILTSFGVLREYDWDNAGCPSGYHMASQSTLRALQIEPLYVWLRLSR